MHRKIITGILFFVFAAFMTVAQAAEEKIDLRSEVWEKAKGEAIIKDLSKEQKEVNVKVSNLQPNSVYTVWFVNEQPRMDMAGVGAGDFAFRTDDKGNGLYTANVSASEVDKWDSLEVALHPDGNPRNMENIQIALKGDIEESK